MRIDIRRLNMFVYWFDFEIMKYCHGVDMCCVCVRLGVGVEKGGNLG